MAFQKKHRKLTRQTAKKLRAGESGTVDFKLKAAGLQVDDLVAFANTDIGGEIFLGVDEKKNANGSQFGVPVGCDLSDEIVLQILNKAISAVPPVSIKLFAENLDANPIIRVTIPSSSSRPHCTPKGVYVCRDGSRNRPLHPPELLRIFLETESKTFAEKFENASNAISSEINTLERSITSSVENMASQLGWVDIQLGDTEHGMSEAVAQSKLAYKEAKDISSRLRALFKQDEREDPVYKRVRNEYLDAVIKQIKSDRKLIEKLKKRPKLLQLSATGLAASELSEKDLKEIVEEAFKIVTGENFTIRDPKS